MSLLGYVRLEMTLRIPGRCGTSAPGERQAFEAELTAVLSDRIVVAEPVARDAFVPFLEGNGS